MTIEDLKETAALAHLNLGDEELVVAFPVFERMLGYFAAMQAAGRDEAFFRLFPDAPGTETLAGQNAGTRLVSSDAFRADGPLPDDGGNLPSREAAFNLLNNAGDRDGNFLVIPNVL